VNCPKPSFGGWRYAQEARAPSRWPSAWIAKLTTIPLTITILRRAGVLPPPDLRPLDSIHLATALSLDEVVAEFACYDARLAEAAERSGLSVVAPT
jgi:predicted nucleic acid-binding protein